MSIIYISVIVVLNMVGVGYGYWANSVKMQAMVSTGEIKAVFGRADITFENSPEKLSWASCNGKRMHISMENAYPGYYAVINYEVKNEGTIPIICDTPEITIDQTGNLYPVSVEVTPPSGTINGYGESKMGTIALRVEGDNSNSIETNQIFHIDPLNLPDMEGCGFAMRLMYHQDTGSN